MLKTLALAALPLVASALLPVPATADPASAIRYLQQGGMIEVDTSGANVTMTTPFAIASVGKAMTSVALLRLVDRGVLDLDDAAADWVPADIVAEWDGLQDITIRHLLAMTSGLPDYLDDAYMDAALSNPTAIQTPRGALNFAADYPPSFQPGEGFEYSNTNYVLAGLILEQASGVSYAQAITREIITPSGLHNTFVFGTRALPAAFPTGHEDGIHHRAYYEHQGFGDGAVIASAQDVARFYKALFIDHTLLHPATLTAFLSDNSGSEYGLGMEVEGDILGHSGGDLGFSSDVRINIATGVIAVILVASSDADTDWAYDAVTQD